MKKIFSTTLLLITTLTFSGCWDNDTLDEDYISVYPGLTLYVGATNTNEIALDGVSIGMRLGLLINEIEQSGEDLTITTTEGEEPAWDALGSYSFSSVSVNRKKLLLGDDDEVAIWRDATDENIYYIKYGKTDDGLDYHTQAWFDNLYRRGTFMIDTKGIKLEETTIENPWAINAATGAITYSSGSSVLYTANYTCDYSSATEIYFGILDETADEEDQVKGLFYSITAIAPSIYDSSDSDAYWTMNGSVEIVDYDVETDTFNIENTHDKRYYLDIYGTGTPMGVPSMTFTTNTPIEMRPETTGFIKYNSYMTIKLTSTSSEYDATSVYVEIRNDGGMNVEYNGVTYYED